MTEQNINITTVIAETDTAWGMPLQPLGCPVCGHAYLISQTLLQSSTPQVVCPGCAQAYLQPQPAQLRNQPPEKVIPFRVQSDELRAVLDEFVKGVWLRCDDFNPDKLLERVKPLHLPMWLVDSYLNGSWQAEMGYSYQVKSSQDSYTGSGWESREYLENRLRWESRLGQINLQYDNTIAQAMSDHEQWTGRVGRFSPDTATAYEPDLINEAVLRVPDLDTTEAWPLAEDAIKHRLAQDCMKAAGARQLRRFTAHLEYDRLDWTQLLLPVYSTWYSDDNGKRYPVYINGQSGGIGGLRIASQRKGWKWAGITAAVGMGFLLLAIICFALVVVFPPIGVAAAVMAVLALLILIGAIIPAVWPWQWNKNQR